MTVFKFKKMFGELEWDIMEVVWKLKKASVRDVLDVLEKKRKIAYTTVMTVMFRLHEKHFLKRHLEASGAYLYAPAHEKDLFLAEASKIAINNIIKEFGDVAVAQFFDVIDSSSSKDIKKWKDKLRKI